MLSFKAIEYPALLQERLKSAHLLNGLDLEILENEYSNYVAKNVLDSLIDFNENIDFIACHGHTIFHRPEIGLTYQMLDGGLVAHRTGITTVCDFRRGDVAQGGQGAPLVPIGDSRLFAEYTGCLNLGGFANLSFSDQGKRIAYDISPANIVLNYLAERKGVKYDMNGDLARIGTIDNGLLEKLNNLSFYSEKPPKSLGREWMEREIIPLIETGKTDDLLATCTLHIGIQIANSLNAISQKGKVLVTGGGAFNSHLIDTIRAHTNQSLHLPDADIINGKEAILFGYLGYLRMNAEVNILSSVTGGANDICGGAVYLGR